MAAKSASNTSSPRWGLRLGFPVAPTSRVAGWNFGAENWSYSEGNET
jgi:hypothetical protein